MTKISFAAYHPHPQAQLQGQAAHELGVRLDQDAEGEDPLGRPGEDDVAALAQQWATSSISAQAPLPGKAARW